MSLETSRLRGGTDGGGGAIGAAAGKGAEVRGGGGFEREGEDMPSMRSLGGSSKGMSFIEGMERSSSSSGTIPAAASSRRRRPSMRRYCQSPLMVRSMSGGSGEV